MSLKRTYWEDVLTFTYKLVKNEEGPVIVLYKMNPRNSQFKIHNRYNKYIDIIYHQLKMFFDKINHIKVLQKFCSVFHRFFSSDFHFEVFSVDYL